MRTARFHFFGRQCSGRLVTSEAGLKVIASHYPYGSQELILVDGQTGAAIHHGTAGVVRFVKSWMPARRYRRVRKFLAARGIMTPLAQAVGGPRTG